MASADRQCRRYLVVQRFTTSPVRHLSSGNVSRYPLTSQPQRLASDEIHVWEIPLSNSPETIPNPACCLSPEELTRAARFHFPHHRARWMSAHRALRQILACYVDRNADELQFVTNPHGKPALAAADPQLEFNLTHSEDLALLAVAQQDVGIDVEYLRDSCDWDRLSDRVFTAREWSPLEQLPADENRTRRCYELWTAKEAYIKARGVGMSLPLRKFSVPLPDAHGVAGPVIDTGVGDGRSWYIRRVRTLSGYVAAVAYPRYDVTIRTARWPFDANASGSR
jgi:4'-phosphopantetheinyl transferase